MNRHDNFRFVLLFGFLLSLAGVLLGQGKPDTILVVNGRTAGAAVRQIDGRFYVDIETLAQITNGEVTVEPTRIVLTIPGSDSRAALSAAPPQATQGLSRDFAKAAIADLAEMREWQGAIGAMITYGLAVSGTWAQEYHARVEESLRQATEAASTEADRNALQLLRNESGKLVGWANAVFAERQALNAARTVDPNALQNDPVLARITSCGRFLNAMLVSGEFADDPSCH
jgi:hypothetical protein